MRRVIFTIIAALLFIACLIVGVRAGMSTPLGLFNRPTPTFIPTARLPNQRIILFILSDDLAQEQPRLVSVWLFFTSLDQMHVNLVLLYPASNTGTADLARRLENKFSLSPSRSPSDDFLSALADLRIHWSGYVLTDLTGLSNVVDWLGGIDAGGGMVNGAAAVQNFPLPDHDPDVFINRLQTLSDGICNKVGYLPHDTNWISMFIHMNPDHFNTDLDFADIIKDWKIYSESPYPLTCELTIP